MVPKVRAVAPRSALVCRGADAATKNIKKYFMLFIILFFKITSISELDCSQDVKIIIEEHLSALILWFKKYILNENFD